MKSKVTLPKGHPQLTKSATVTHAELDNAKVKMLKEQIKKHHSGVLGGFEKRRRLLLSAPDIRWQRGPYKNQWNSKRDVPDPKPSLQMK